MFKGIKFLVVWRVPKRRGRWQGWETRPANKTSFCHFHFRSHFHFPTDNDEVEEDKEKEKKDKGEEEENELSEKVRRADWLQWLQ